MNDRFNTIAGWVLFAGIIGLGFSILSGKYFHANDPEMPETPGYDIVVVGGEDGEEAATPLGNLLAEASAADGESIFAKCQGCHSIQQGGPNGTGPNLYGIMGKPKAAVAGFGYSSALKEKGGQWGWEEMDAWLAAPKKYVPGTSMGFAGLGKDTDRAALMLYMETFGGAPAKPEVVDLSAEEEPAADAIPAEGVEADAPVSEDVAVAAE